VSVDRLHILIGFPQDRGSCYIVFPELLYDDVLLAYRKHLHDQTTSLRGEAWDHTTSLTLSLLLKCLCEAWKVSKEEYVCQGYGGFRNRNVR
jgi:hypothetical protein